MTKTQLLSQAELRETVRPWLPANLPDVTEDDVLDGVVLALTPHEKRTLPLVRNPFREGAAFAWREEDASATELALTLLAQIGEALLNGKLGLLKIGFAVKDIVAFLIKLRRHGVYVTDPLQVKLLMLLRESKAGLTAAQLQTQNEDNDAPSVPDIEAALKALEHAEAGNLKKPLVRHDLMIWKSLV